MSLSKLTKDMAVIQKLDDEPNDVGGLTAAQLKGKFDEAGEAVKEFLNETLLPELDSPQAAGNLGAVLSGEEMTVQQALETLHRATIQSGNVPVGGGAGDVLQKSSDELYDLEWRPLLTTVSFSAQDWVLQEIEEETSAQDDQEAETEEDAEDDQDVEAEENAADSQETEAEDDDSGDRVPLYQLTISSQVHHRRNGAFGCTLRHLVDGVLKSNTWAVLGTQVVYEEETGDVTLLSPDAYDGTALFYGGQEPV
jgi:hypothetical protein